MFIPNVNISAYRRQYDTSNVEQMVPILCNEDTRNPRFIGMQRALVAGYLDEGARYRGYGCYDPSGGCGCCNIYCPIYYNDKSSYRGQNDWFISNANEKLSNF